MINYIYVNMKEEIAKALRTELDLAGYNKVAVMKSDVVDAGHIPSICVNRIDDTESNPAINDDLDSEFDEELEKWVEYKGTFFAESLEIRVWHLNADERDSLYILTKAILFSMRPELVKKGIINIRLRGGKDEQDTSLLPYPVYWAAINMDYLNPLEISAIIQDDTGIISQISSVMTIINDSAEGSGG